MTKTQIVTHFAEYFEVTKKDASLWLDELAVFAAKETKRNGTFTIPGIGKLRKNKRKACMGHNPAASESIKIPKTCKY